MVEKEILKELRERAISDLANFLVNRFGFSFQEAVRESINFWKRNEKKLKEVISI